MLDNARRQYSLGEFRNCIELLQKYLAANPCDANAWILFGYANDQLAHLRLVGAEKIPIFEEAKKAFERCLSLGSKREALHGLATVAMHKGDFPHARQFYTRLISSFPKDSKLFLSIGNVERHLGHLNEAIKWYNRYLETSGKDWNVLSNLALTHAENGDKTAAADFARQAIALMPEGTVDFDALRSKLKKIIRA